MTDYIHQPAKIRVWEPLLVVLLAIVGIIYAINVFNTGDWLFHKSYVEWDGEEYKQRQFSTQSFNSPASIETR